MGYKFVHSNYIRKGMRINCFPDTFSLKFLTWFIEGEKFENKCTLQLMAETYEIIVTDNTRLPISNINSMFIDSATTKIYSILNNTLKYLQLNKLGGYDNLYIGITEKDESIFDIVIRISKYTNRHIIRFSLLPNEVNLFEQFMDYAKSYGNLVHFHQLRLRVSKVWKSKLTMCAMILSNLLKKYWKKKKII